MMWLIYCFGLFFLQYHSHAGQVGTFQLTATKKTMATAGLGVPVKLLHESLGHIITVELKTGQLYRGKLAEGMFKSLASSLPD